MKKYRKCPALLLSAILELELGYMSVKFYIYLMIIYDICIVYSTDGNVRNAIKLPLYENPPNKKS